jgi:hypothetical protein
LGGLAAGSLAAGVEREFAQEFAGVGVDDAELPAAGSATLPLGAAATVAADALTVTDRRARARGEIACR